MTYEAVIRARPKWLDALLWLLGKVTRHDYSSYVQTIMGVIYVPHSFEYWSMDAKEELIAHEMVHVQQQHEWPIKPLAATPLWRINAVLFSVAYLLLPLPVLWTFRAKFEAEAYQVSLLVERKQGYLTDASREAKIERYIQRFGGGSYGWMATKKKAKLIAERIVHHALLQPPRAD